MIFSIKQSKEKKMSNLALVIKDTVKKEIRNKALVIIFVLNIIIFSIVTAGVDFVISMVGNEGVPLDLNAQKIHVFIFFINKWVGLLAILFGIGCVKTDEDDGILGQLISLPIMRSEYLVGRIIGSSLIVFAFYLLMLLFAAIALTIGGASWPMNPEFLLSLPVKLIYISSVILLSVMISLFTSKIISFVMTMVAFVTIDISGAMNGGKSISELFSDLSIFKGFNLFIYGLFPHLGELDRIVGDLIFKTNEVSSPWIELGHSFFSIGLLFVILNLIFRRKEL
jgi:ABC-type transport system involved in multi-copper enzyme maturation permease subunit